MIVKVHSLHGIKVCYYEYYVLRKTTEIQTSAILFSFSEFWSSFVRMLSDADISQIFRTQLDSHDTILCSTRLTQGNCYHINSIFSIYAHIFRATTVFNISSSTYRISF